MPAEYKIQLSNEHHGTVTLMTDPTGLDNIEIELKRDPSNDGVFYEFTMNIDFHEEARAYIARIFEAYGPEAHIAVSLYEYDPNRYHWTLYYTGKLKLSNYRVNALAVSTNIEQTGFQRKFINLTDRDVPFTGFRSIGGKQLPAVPSISLPLHAKTILKSLKAGPADSNVHSLLAGGNPTFYEFTLPKLSGKGFYGDAIFYAQIDLTKPAISELTTNHSLPSGIADFFKIMFPATRENDPPAPGSVPFYIDKLMQQPTLDPRAPAYTADEAGTVDIEVSLKLQHTVNAQNEGGDIDICGSGALGHTEVYAWVEHRAENNTVKFIENVGKWDTIEGCGGYQRVSEFEKKNYRKEGVTVDVGDKIYLYYTLRIHGEYEAPSGFENGHVFHTARIEADAEETYLQISSNTVFEETQSRAVLIHEAFKAVVESNTDQEGSFYSEHFGRTDIGYAADGKGSKRAIINGRAIRQQFIQTLFVNWDELFKSMNSIDCLSWGFERRNGQEIVRVEPKSYFYNKNLVVLELGEVARLEKRNAERLYYTQIDTGFPKIEVIQQSNGVDEFNMPRRYTMPLTQSKQKLQIISPYRASGFEIEYQRRQRGKSEESRLDDANFIICLERSGEGWVTETNTDFPVMSGVLNPDSVYNARISPGRNIRNWSQVLASNLTRQSDKALRFSYGELNYQMESRTTDEVTTIHEGGDVDLTGIEPIWLPEIYQFESRLTADEFKLIRESPYGVVKFRDELKNVKEGFVLRVNHSPLENKGEFELLRVYRPAQGL